MHKSGADPKVKKTLHRNYEQKIRPTKQKHVIYEAKACSSKLIKSSRSSQKENELSVPRLCSSEVLANYLSDVKKSPPPPVSPENLVDKNQLCAQMTKKLNFHFNDNIYKNLIELNANIEDMKTRKGKKPTSSIGSIKKDLEPNIEDFYGDTKEKDVPPNIPVVKPKFKSVKRVESGQLHTLVGSFENL